MKNIFFAMSLLLSVNAFSAAKEISLQCEQGIGNVSNPDPIIQIEGRIADNRKIGEYSLQEKNLLQISVFTGNRRMEKLNSNEFKINILPPKIGSEYGPQMEIIILSERVGALSYLVTNLEGLGSLVQVEKAAKIAGKRNWADGGMCNGVNPL